MRTSRIEAVVVMVGALALVGGGVVAAKPHGDRGVGTERKGGPHGGPKDRSDGGHGQGNGAGRGDGSERGAKPKPAGGACDFAASSPVQAFVDATCPCAGLDDGAGAIVAWKNHGRYVRCVARAVKQAARAAGVKRRCVRDLVPCAAGSTCGRRNAVTCVTAVPGACNGGVCDGDPGRPCAADVDCATSTCGITTPDGCVDLGGTPASGSCCAASPGGAFVD